MVTKGGKGKTNSVLKSWVTFVKKVQKEEGITYPEAMKRAKARKSEWKRGGSMDTEDDGMMPSSSPSSSSSLVSSSGYDGDMSSSPSSSPAELNDLSGGKRKRRTKKRKGSKKRRGTKKRRGGNPFKKGMM